MSTISASTTSTTAYKVTADTTGTLVLQTGSTPTTAVTIGTDQKVAFAAGISNGLNVSGSGWGVLPYVSSSLVVDNNAGQARFFATGDASNFGSYIWYGGKTGGSTSTYMAIDTGGNVSVGTASAATKFTVSGNGSFLASSQLRFYNSNNTNWSYIDCPATDGTGPLRFTVGSGEAGRFDNSGRLLMGATTSYTDYANIQITGDNKGVAIRDSTDNSYRAIYNQSGSLYFFNGSNEGYLSTAGAWINASDERLKTNVREIEYGLSTVLTTQPRHYERVDIDGTYIGFVAQELQTIIPEVVSGNPEKQLGVDYGSLVAVAFKAIQEQQAIIETLTNRITALEAK